MWKALTPTFPITINGNVLDQSVKTATDASKTKYILVQSQVRLSPSQRQELAVAGLELHDYVSKNTYLYGYKGVDLERIRRMEPVVYVDIYRSEFKVVPSLKGIVPDSPYHVDVAFHKDVDSDSKSLRDLIAEKSHLNAEDIKFFRYKSRLTIQGQYLDQVASVDEVRRIENVGNPKLRNDQARLILRADNQPGPGPGIELGQTYKGQGQVIAIADTGLDTGQIPSVHPAFGNRVRWLYPLCGATADSHGHGTHVCGSAVGDGLMKNGVHIMGTAPQSTLVVQCLGDATFGDSLPGDLTELFEKPYDDYRARVHSNSWGNDMEDEQRKYDHRAEEIDRFVWTHPEMVICFAAGNEASDYYGTGDVGQGQIGAEAAAKNCITVGASENYRQNAQDTYGDTYPANFPLPPLSLRREAENSFRVAAFSSRGPTKEGRFKPDVVAPGTCILSANSSHVAHPKRPSPDQHWCYQSGTSMATPLVAGCAAVLREAVIKKGTYEPSAALIKALLINGAEILSQPSPSVDSGFGRVNLANSLAIVHGEERAAFREDKFEQLNEEPFSIRISVGSELAALKATLVWSDPDGEMIRNSLLLEVQHADGIHLEGYDPDDYDNLNNVQQVLWQNTPHGDVTITVKCYDVQELPQAFAVIWRLY